MSYVARHWRGELSLGVSFWVNNVLLMLPLGVAVGLLMAWIAGWGQSLQSASIALLVGGALLAVVSVWAPVGGWRAAVEYRRQGGAFIWGFLARLVLGLAMLSNTATLALDVLPELPSQLKLAFGRDPIGRLDVALAPDGRSLTLTGAIDMDASGRVRAALAQAPHVERVLLASPGGRLYEAREIAATVRSRGLQTRAVADCASACTVVFVAGAGRSVAPGARLGFHRASVGSFNPLHEQLANRKLAALYDDAGLPRGFVAQVLRTPAWTMWFPPVPELVAAGVLPAPTLLPELDDRLGADAPLASYRDALAGNLLWTALEERRAGVMDDAAKRMHDARRRGLDLGAVALAAQAVALDAMPAVLRSAAAPAVDGFLAALAAELHDRRAGGDVACRSALGATRADGGAPPSPHLAGWLQGALLDPAAAAPPAAPLSPIELEVLRRELGDGGPERIAALSAPAPRRAGCGAIGILEAIARLKPPQRRLAARLLLQPPG